MTEYQLNEFTKANKEEQIFTSFLREQRYINEQKEQTLGHSIKKRHSDRTTRPVRFFRTFALDELEESSLDTSLHQTQIRSLLS